jgi:hypothetical protein
MRTALQPVRIAPKQPGLPVLQGSLPKFFVIVHAQNITWLGRRGG